MSYRVVTYVVNNDKKTLKGRFICVEESHIAGSERNLHLKLWETMHNNISEISEKLKVKMSYLC